MFTGIVEQVGTLERRWPAADRVNLNLEISAGFSGELTIGESVSVMGVCLTVVEQSSNRFTVQCTTTTWEITALKTLGPGDSVNLERSVTPQTRMGGHWVLGHVDTTGTVAAIVAEGDARHVTIRFPAEFGRLVVDKGSVTVDGVSLTVVERGPDWFSLTLIPHTQSVTTLARLTTGGPVNLEFDALAKYVDALLSPYRTAPTTERRNPQ